MNIVAVSTVYGDDDIAPLTIEHLFDQGVTSVIVESPQPHEDSAWRLELQEGHPDHYFSSWRTETFHDQPRLIMGELAWLEDMGRLSDGDWVIPFDADEFVYADWAGHTIAEALERLGPADVEIRMPYFQHTDWWHRRPMPTGQKVAFRYHPAVSLLPGNHGLAVRPEGTVLGGVLTIRELQYRSFEQFCAKVEARNRTIDPTLGPAYGSHHKALAGLGTAQLRERYEALMAEPTIWDPIPTRRLPDTPAYIQPRSLDQLLDEAKREPNDIAAHLDRLAELGRGKSVLELGVNTGMSTVAFLAGGCKSLRSIDIAPMRVHPELWLEDRWSTLEGISSLEAGPPREHSIDVLFIDTDHTFRTTIEELRRWHRGVKPGGHIVLHDTESHPEGVGAALDRFKREMAIPEELIEHVHGCNGMAIVQVAE